MKILILFLLLNLIVCGTLVSCNSDSKETKKEIVFDSFPPSVDTLLPENLIVADATNPDELINIIKQLQKKYVRESWGLQEGECFTESDLKEFRNSKVVYNIISTLQKDKNFRALIDVINRLPSNRRSEFLSRAENTYKKTWRELNLNPATSTRAELLTGQTEAGAEAEKDITQAIVSLVVRGINQ